MKAVVADTGPLRYLVLIEVVDVLPRLFEQVLVPEIVAFELSRPSTPSPVREWLEATPAWLTRQPGPPALAGLPRQLGAGERAAIGLARALVDALLVIDDRAGIAAARERDIEATGTLGVLIRAAQLGLVDLRAALTRLRHKFPISPGPAR